jgi:HTH-type transcriptional regulator/antitoxin HigA
MTSAASAYGELLSREKPEVISGEQQNRLYIERLEKLTAKKSVTPAEKKLLVPDAEPRAIIRHLMEAHNLRQKDLLDVFGTESIVSDVLRGKRELTKQHIRRLSTRFQVSVGPQCSSKLGSLAIASFTQRSVNGRTTWQNIQSAVPPGV